MTPNGVLFQYFHWHSKNDGSLWRELAERAQALKDVGITAIWIPPAYKGAEGAEDRGYGVYDLFDLGEFDQKGSVRTRYGTRDELHKAIQSVHAAGLQVYADIVLNHRQGADEQEEVTAVEVDKLDRTMIASDPYQMHAWTKFNFRARGNKYSAFTWNSSCFTSTDVNADAPNADKIYLLNGKTFSDGVSTEFGNFDHLMGCDVDENNEHVRGELFYWGRWFVDVTGVDGFRVDAVKHMPPSFFKDFFNHLRTHFGSRELLAIGEYWSGDVAELQKFLADSDGVMKLFDAPLHGNFTKAAEEGDAFDLRTIFDGSLTQVDPLSSVTIVDNHDTQPGQPLESWVHDSFKPLAYALILLREEGYPCIFYPDYFGHAGEANALTSHRTLLDVMLDARRKFNFGDQHDHFDDPNCIAWVRTGNPDHPGSMIVVLSNGKAGTKRLNAFAKNAAFFDMTGHITDAVKTDADGNGDFRCPAGSVSVWVQA